MALLVLSRKNIQKPPLVASIGSWPYSLQRKNILPVLTIGVRAGLAGVVVPAADCVVEHFDNHLVVPLVEEGALAAGLEREVAGKLVPSRVQVHLALPVEQDLDRPPAEVAAGLV